jgi:integrase
MRDQLEVLTALIDGPSFDPLFRAEAEIVVPGDHVVYRWLCLVEACERVRSSGGGDLCSVHSGQWTAARRAGATLGVFLRTAQPLPMSEWSRERSCRICPQRPATSLGWQLCPRHHSRWMRMRSTTDFAAWLADQHPYDGYGACRIPICDQQALSPLLLCLYHERYYREAGRPGGARLPRTYWTTYEVRGLPVPIHFNDELAFHRWCQAADPVCWPGRLVLRGLRPLLRAELRWGLFRHTQRPDTRWRLADLQGLINDCRRRQVDSLADLDVDALAHAARGIVLEILHELRLVYFTPADTREAGFIDTDHFGVRFTHRGSFIDLTPIAQRWLRDLVWDQMAATLRSVHRPRRGGPFDILRRAATELGAFLLADAPAGGHDPAVLQAEHMRRFVADMRRREREGLPSLVTIDAQGNPCPVTAVTRSCVFNAIRRLLRTAMDNGAADRLGLDRGFIVAVPYGDTPPTRARAPFSDEIARAVVDEANLRRLEELDVNGRGLRDIWETIVATGRRGGEVVNVGLDCIGRYGGLPMLWHDQTKVGNYDQAVRIPESVYQRLEARQHATVTTFSDRHGRAPTSKERTRMALFPGTRANPDGRRPLSYGWFQNLFRTWITDLDLDRCVPHQARHTLATNLLRAGATISHVRRYLGHVSDRMAEHYIHVAVSEIEDILQHVWVAGPGAANPGELLSEPTQALTREQAMALAVDLSRRSTPADGGFCTFQPVVDGGACPWKLDCHNCDKFVLSGADLLYWRRKREQWASLAERAPDDATADYLHQVFEPTARAIDGLEKTLAGLGLLQDALALDLRRPQDYFHRLWSLNFPARDLARAQVSTPDQPEEWQ